MSALRKPTPSYIVPSRMEQEISIGHMLEHMDALDAMRGPLPPMLKYSRESFLTKFGRPYFVDHATFAGKQGRQKECYANAGRRALIARHTDAELTYVEGITTCYGIPIEHAWLALGDRVIDPTVRPHDGTGVYFGVPFKTNYLQAKTCEHGVWGLMGFPNIKDLLTGTDAPERFLA